MLGRFEVSKYTLIQRIISSNVGVDPLSFIGELETRFRGKLIVGYHLIVEAKRPCER